MLQQGWVPNRHLNFCRVVSFYELFCPGYWDSGALCRSLAASWIWPLRSMTSPKEIFSRLSLYRLPITSASTASVRTTATLDTRSAGTLICWRGALQPSCPPLILLSERYHLHSERPLLTYFNLLKRSDPKWVSASGHEENLFHIFCIKVVLKYLLRRIHLKKTFG